MKEFNVDQYLNITSLLLFLFLFNSCGSSGSLGLKDEDKAFIEGIYPAVAESWNAGDRQPYLDRLSDDAVYMVPNQELLKGKEAIIPFVMSFPDVTSEFTVVEIWGNSDMVNVRGKYASKDAQGNVLDKGKFINLFQKNSEGRWVATHDIWNSDLPPAPGNLDSAD